MSMTYYTVDDLRSGRSGWGVKRFSALNDAISHYRSLPSILFQFALYREL